MQKYQTQILYFHHLFKRKVNITFTQPNDKQKLHPNCSNYDSSQLCNVEYQAFKSKN